MWDKYWDQLCDDVLYMLRKILKRPNLKLSPKQIQNYGLVQIEDLLRKNGISLHDIQCMPKPSRRLLETVMNQLIAEAMSYNTEQSSREFHDFYRGLNAGQLNAYQAIMDSVERQQGEIFFVYGHGGTGKTYLWHTIVNKLRSDGKIALAVASSGIASLLLPGGRTAHSRFHFPLTTLDGTTCNTKQGSPLAGLIKETSTIIWDEAPMANKHTFETLDHTLKDILKFTNEDGSNRPFGGMTVVLGGDFRQILSVVPKGGRPEIIDATITRSHLWDHVKVLRLNQNMHLNGSLNKGNGTTAEFDFAKWILEIGDGKNSDLNGDSWEEIPSDIIL